MNLAFFSEEEAAEALVGLTDPSEFYDSESIAPLQLRRAKSVPERESIKLQVRVATEQDRKERGARARSRYYLMHGEPTRELTRHRRKQEDEYIVYHLDRQRAKRQAESEDLLPGVLAKEADNDLFPDMARDKYEHKTAREHKQKLNKNDSTRFRDSSHSEHDFSQRVGVRERSPLRADRSNNKNGDLLPQVKNKPSYLSGNDDSITRTRSRSRSPDFGSRLQLTKENRPRRHRRHRRKAEDLF